MFGKISDAKHAYNYVEQKFQKTGPKHGSKCDAPQKNINTHLNDA